MPPSRLLPLVAAGLACLTLAACGSDDDPTPQAGGGTSSASDSRAAAQTDAGSDGADPGAASTPSSSDDDPKRPQAQENPLADYAAGGAPATEREAADVRATLVGFQEALGRKDIIAVCALTVGLPETSGPMSCKSLTEGPGGAPPTDENRKLIAESKVIVSKDKATAELTEGFLMPLRRIDGRWHIDYGAINNPGAGQR